MAGVLANVPIPHVAVSVVTRRYMPGVATGEVLNIPALSLLVVLALREGYISRWEAVVYSVGVTSIGILSIPALFKLGTIFNL